MEDLVFTVAQVAKLLHTNPNYVYSLIKNGYLPAMKFRSYRIRKKALEDFLEKYENQDLSQL